MDRFNPQALRKLTPACCTLALLCCLGLPFAANAQDQSKPNCTAKEPDNTSRNKAHDTTADQQKENQSDRMVTKNIRHAIVSDKSLSTYAHNVKIITQNGAVTLKGPVRSEDEKQAVEAKAREAGGGATITNELTVK
jgi:hyperosmotically inducible protein